MASVLGGFVGRLDQESALNDVTVLIPLPAGADPFTARHLLIQTFEPTCERGQSGRVSARIEGVLGPMERSLYPQYEDYWTALRLPPADEKADRPVGTVDGPFSQCGCIPEVNGCDRADEAEPLEISRPVRGKGFVVTLNLRLAHLNPGTAVRGLVALNDLEPQDQGNAEPPDNRHEPADAPDPRDAQPRH
jgi:hypothetical protein